MLSCDTYSWHDQSNDTYSWHDIIIIFMNTTKMQLGWIDGYCYLAMHAYIDKFIYDAHEYLHAVKYGTIATSSVLCTQGQSSPSIRHQHVSAFDCNYLLSYKLSYCYLMLVSVTGTTHGLTVCPVTVHEAVENFKKCSGLLHQVVRAANATEQVGLYKKTWNKRRVWPISEAS